MSENKDQKKETQENNKQEKQEEKPVKNTILGELKNHLRILAKSLQANDTKTVQKITKQVKRFKKNFKPHHLEKVWDLFFPGSGIDFKSMKGYEANFEEVFDIPKKNLQSMAKFPEIQLYLEVLLMITYFYQRDINTDNRAKYLQLATQQSEKLLEQTQSISKRSLDYLNSFIYFYFFRAKELSNQLLTIRDKLFELYRTACLRFDEIGQATLLNLILRNYLNYNHFEAAQHLISKSTFPEQASNNEYCRYLYYTGRIKAIQLEYSESLSRLNQALRKAPDNTALGFRIETQKLAIVVELLLGEIPERNIFAQTDLQKALIPYYKLVQCILKGNLLDFTATVAKYATFFIRDKLYTLIMRLHQTVIKTGLRKINLSYSKISFADIALKLQLSKNTEIEFIVAKAIRDGVLRAEIDHDNKCIIISEKKELYNTNEPQVAFQKRIDYCFNLYNQSTKALQYPNQTFKAQDQSKKEDLDIEESDLYSDFDF